MKVRRRNFLYRAAAVATSATAALMVSTRSLIRNLSITADHNRRARRCQLCTRYFGAPYGASAV